MEEIFLFYGENKIIVDKIATFEGLKKETLSKSNILVKYFCYQGDKIKEEMSVINYSKFTSMIDNNKFNEYKKGLYRCSKCRKYLNITKWKCRYTNKYRAYYIFELK